MAFWADVKGSGASISELSPLEIEINAKVQSLKLMTLF